jgi:hypothetical protein
MFLLSCFASQVALGNLGPAPQSGSLVAVTGFNLASLTYAVMQTKTITKTKFINEQAKVVVILAVVSTIIRRTYGVLYRYHQIERDTQFPFLDTTAF